MDFVSSLVRRHRRPLIAGALLMIVSRMAALALPAVSRLLYDDVIGAGRADRGAMTPGELLWFAATTGMVAAPLPHIASHAAQLTEALAGLERVAELEAVEADRAVDRGEEPPTPLHGDVRLEGVHFTYATGCAAIRGISLHAPAGSTSIHARA